MSLIRYDEQDIVKVVKVERLGWLGYLFRMQELYPCRRLTLIKQEGTRSVGKPTLRWLESVEEELRNICAWGAADLSGRREKGGGQFWKRLRYTENCNARRGR